MIKIISDSSILYSAKEGEENNIDIAYLSVTIDNKTYKEREEIDTEEFIKIINEGNIPTTSQPSVGEVVNLYNKYPEDEIINIALADGLSGTYNSACMAKNMVDNSDRISVINTKTLCGPQKYIAQTAVELSEKGLSKDEILNEIDILINNSKSFLIPNDFDYLVRGGRLSSLAGKVGGLIKLVPVMTLSEDCTRLVKFTTKRTFNKAVEKICEELINAGVDSNYNIYISHACTESLANEAKNIIMKKIENANIEINMLGPVFTAQGGPGCVAIQSIKKSSIL